MIKLRLPRYRQATRHRYSTTALRATAAAAVAVAAMTAIGGVANASARPSNPVAATVTAAMAAAAPTSGQPATSTIVPDPSWTCGMPNGIPDPTRGTLVARATLQIGATHDAGNTQYGHRRVFDVKGGQLTGDRVKATVLTGGMDMELTLSNGAVELEQVNMLRLSDNSVAYMRNCGVAPAGTATVRVVVDIEVANSSSLAWLNTTSLVGTRTVDTATGSIEMAVYDVSKVTTDGAKLRLADPAGVANQSWDCATGTGRKGATVFSESVRLGSSLSVGASKRGTRNVIPITGGTVTGRLTGSVVAGGADYQLMGSGSARLDARYALSTSDGEYVLVRNCGPMGALVPAFETRANGPYAFLNTNRYLSSDPGMASGGVSITFYERS